jgi:hypothetical protein
LLLVLSAWSAFRYQKEREDRYIWLFHIFITLGMATKPVLFPLAVLTIPFSVVLFITTRKIKWLLAMLIPLVWIIGFTAWNHHRSGSFQYSSIQTANLVNYNLRYFVMSQEGAEAASEKVDGLYESCNTEESYSEKVKCLEQGVREVILDQPVRYAIFHLKGCMRYFIDPGRFDLVTFFSLEEPDSQGFLYVLNQDGLPGVLRFLREQGWGLIILLMVIVLFKLLKVTGFLLYVFRNGTDLPFRIFLIVLVGYLALVTGPLGASRFLLPVELLLIGGAVKGWISLITPSKVK